mmetsp:Transcript_37762/g.85175  ORF Transcript_37762/g.85175 Transcript_37762/m.85175 type:complete len:121 (-) Transcript_37762:189-551(-)
MARRARPCTLLLAALGAWALLALAGLSSSPARGAFVGAPGQARLRAVAMAAAKGEENAEGTDTKSAREQLVDDEQFGKPPPSEEIVATSNVAFVIFSVVSIGLLGAFLYFTAGVGRLPDE